MSDTTFSEDGEIDTFTVSTSGTDVVSLIGTSDVSLGPGGGEGAEAEGTFTLYFCHDSNGSESMP